MMCAPWRECSQLFAVSPTATGYGGDASPPTSTDIAKTGVYPSGSPIKLLFLLSISGMRKMALKKSHSEALRNKYGITSAMRR